MIFFNLRIQDSPEIQAKLKLVDDKKFEEIKKRVEKLEKMEHKGCNSSKHEILFS